VPLLALVEEMFRRMLQLGVATRTMPATAMRRLSTMGKPVAAIRPILATTVEMEEATAKVTARAMDEVMAKGTVEAMEGETIQAPGVPAESVETAEAATEDKEETKPLTALPLVL
jgi:hypothetical protein